MTGRKVGSVLFAIIVLLVGAESVTVAGQGEDEDKDKSIKAEVFLNERPAKGTSTSTSRTVSSARYKAPPKSSTSVGEAPPQGMTFAQLGVTIWRFRASTPEDKTKELIEEEGDAQPSQWTLERVEEGTTFTPGQRVRLSIESLTRNGFLYVINREEYGDGTMGDARLIFPTKRHGANANKVRAGRLIFIPSPPRSFRIRPSQSAKLQVAEVLMFLVTRQPLIDPSELSIRPLVVPNEKITLWQRQWGTKPVKFEMAGGAGQIMTEKEQAAADGGTELAQDDPIPQTMYRVALKPENPVMVTLRLKFATHQP